MELGGRPVDRLTAAKAVLADFLDRRGGDRVGLLVFGQRAYALTPLTLDRDHGAPAARRQRRRPGRPRDRDRRRHRARGQTPATQAGGAARRDPAHRWREHRRRPRSAKAAELARDASVRVHTIAFGGEGALSVFGFSLPMPGARRRDRRSRAAAHRGGRPAAASSARAIPISSPASTPKSIASNRCGARQGGAPAHRALLLAARRALRAAHCWPRVAVRRRA